MNRLFSSLLAVVIIALMASCGSERGAASATSTQDRNIEGVQVPMWVADPSHDQQFGAVGIARPSLGGQNETFKKARSEGRLELARIIATKVQAAYVRYFQEGGEIFAGDRGPEYQMMATEMAEDTSRQLTDQVLQGSKQKAFWEHPVSNDLYVWMVIDPEAEAILAKQIKGAARASVAKRSAIAAELKADEALKRLDAAIDAELERQSGG